MKRGISFILSKNKSAVSLETLKYLTFSWLLFRAYELHCIFLHIFVKHTLDHISTFLKTLHYVSEHFQGKALFLLDDRHILVPKYIPLSYTSALHFLQSPSLFTQ